MDTQSNRSETILLGTLLTTLLGGGLLVALLLAVALAPFAPLLAAAAGGAGGAGPGGLCGAPRGMTLSPASSAGPSTSRPSRVVARPASLSLRDDCGTARPGLPTTRLPGGGDRHGGAGDGDAPARLPAVRDGRVL
jgi:hypothetical protein